MPLLPAKHLRVSPNARHPANPVGIIRQSALCRLCRSRHKRHTFACRRLLAWYRDGTDINEAIDRLSAYLGHAKVSYTYWYLTGMPELLALAGERFERYAASFPGDVP